MTETSPVAATSRPRRRHGGLSEHELREVRAKTGTIFAGLEARIVDEAGEPLPWDGTTVGELQCRGPWVATDYWGGAPEKFQNGWLRTGDMAVMESDGYFRIVDRSKDLVKSGGEWISSVELEGACLAHPAVRPVVVAAVHEPLTLAELREFLTGRVAKWWLPDELVIVDEVAKTSVGKYDKKVLRMQLSHLQLP